MVRRGVRERSGADPNDAAIIHLDQAVKKVQRACIVGHDTNRHAFPIDEVTEHLHHLPSASAVKARGRLIREDQVWLIRQRAGDRDALLLST